jgi:branched-chain amino acid transport system substrate-binding protein
MRDFEYEAIEPGQKNSGGSAATSRLAITNRSPRGSGRADRPTKQEFLSKNGTAGGNSLEATMLRRTVLKGVAAATATGVFAPAVLAQKLLKIGVSMPMTGAGFGTVGPQLKAGIQLYMQQHGDVVADRKIEIIIRDDAGVADTARRLIQEMIVNDRVDVCAIGITPTALAIAQLATQAKKATLVMSSGASATTTRSPYFVRAGFLLSPQSWIIAEWAAKNGSQRVVTLVNEWATGLEAETAFKIRFLQVGGTVIESIRVPLANPDFSPFLQRLADLKPDTAFIYFPGPQAATFAKQFAERGLARSAIKIVGPGDLTIDDSLNDMGEQMIGIITAGPYSAAHDSALNKSYVTGIKQAIGFLPNIISLGAYDGMHLLYEALKKTAGNTDGDALIKAMKGMSWESPRGPISIDPETRDIVSNIYIRRVEKLNGQLWNTEFETFPGVKDPLRA